MSDIDIGEEWELTTYNVASADIQLTTTRACKSFAIIERTGTLALQFRRTENATPYWPIFIGVPFSANIRRGRRSSDVSARTYSIGWVRRDDGSGSTTPVVLLVTY